VLAIGGLSPFMADIPNYTAIERVIQMSEVKAL
jgi:hypothetical protein